jgi:hypothetical protein
MTALLQRCTFALLAVIWTAACGASPNTPDPVCMEAGATNLGGPLPCIHPVPVPAVAFAELVGTSPASPATRMALNILPDGTKVGDPPIKATIRFGLSQAQIDEIKANGEAGLVEVCLSADGVNPVKGGCDIHWVEEGKTTDTVSFSLVVAKFYEYVEKTPHILVTIIRRSRTDLSKPRTVFSDGKFPLRVDFTWK